MQFYPQVWVRHGFSVKIAERQGKSKAKLQKKQGGVGIESGTQELKKLSNPLNVGIKALTGTGFVYNWVEVGSHLHMSYFRSLPLFQLVLFYS